MTTPSDELDVRAKTLDAISDRLEGPGDVPLDELAALAEHVLAASQAVTDALRQDV